MRQKKGIDNDTLKECGLWAESGDYLIVVDEDVVVIKYKETAYFGTREEYYKRFSKDTVQDLYTLIAKKEGLRFCYECGKPLKDYEDLYCDACRDEAVKRDTQKLRDFDIGNESKDVGFYALAGAIVADAQKEYMNVLFLLYKNPYDETLLKRLKAIEEELPVAYINDARKKTRKAWLLWIYNEMKEIERGESKQRKG